SSDSRVTTKSQATSRAAAHWHARRACACKASPVTPRAVRIEALKKAMGTPLKMCSKSSSDSMTHAGAAAHRTRQASTNWRMPRSTRSVMEAFSVLWNEKMRRRELLKGAAAGLTARRLSGLAEPAMPTAAVRVMTPPPKHHFFGYYGIPPWNRSQTRLVCLEVDFQDRFPEPGEKARIGFIDAARGGFQPVTETATWNLQQGCMLHWNPLAPDREILFNDRAGGDVITAVLDVESGK